MKTINGMRSYALVALLLFASVSMAFSRAPITLADNVHSVASSLVSSTVGQQNITMHTGDLVLSNNEVLLIKDAQLNLKGNLIMNGNSILILDNGVLYPDFEKGQYSYKLHDNSKIIMQNNSKIESLIFDFMLYDSASIDISDSILSQNIRLDSINATLQAVNSYIRVASIYGYSLIINSTSSELNFYGNARIVNSQIEQFEVSSLYHPIYVDLVNSTYDRLYTDFIGQGVIRVYWYLRVLVESQGTPLQDADVQVYSQANGSLVAQDTTSSDGRVQFELLALEISEHGETYLGDYTIRVNQNQAQTQETVMLNSSMQKTISISTDSQRAQAVMYAVLVIVAALIIGALTILFLKRNRKRLAFD